jgi:hypothetical protein
MWRATRLGGRLKAGLTGVFCVSVSLWCVSPDIAAQQLLDRVVARVGGTAITQTDVMAALALGVVEADAGGDRMQSAMRRLIDRRLMLDEVARFPPPEPAETAIAEQLARMKAAAGTQYDEVLRRAGLDEPRVRQLARDTLRLQAYIDQRFGTMGQVTPHEVRNYYDTHRAEFTRNDALLPFEQVEAAARQLAGADRRRRMVAQWLEDLRDRGEVVEVSPRQ